DQNCDIGNITSQCQMQHKNCEDANGCDTIIEECKTSMVERCQNQEFESAAGSTTLGPQ
nr:Chain A, Attractin [Aplysia californica]